MKQGGLRFLWTRKEFYFLLLFPAARWAHADPPTESPLPQLLWRSGRVPDLPTGGTVRHPGIWGTFKGSSRGLRSPEVEVKEIQF
jgi:hypothetical protein